MIFIGRHIPGGSKLLRNGKQELFLAFPGDTDTKEESMRN